MQSLQRQIQKKLAKAKEKLSMDNRGVFGLDSVKSFTVLILTIFILFFVVLAISAFLRGSSILPSGSQEANDSVGILNNMTAGIKTFAASAPVLFGVLVLVSIMLMFGVVLFVISRFGGGGRGGTVG